MKKEGLLFDDFNAKYTSLEEVATTFVSNIDFFNLAKNNHTFVLGPRGCGKTTMFKMLTPSAINVWKPKPGAESLLKDNFPFIGIYIPSDELWKDQLAQITSSISSDEKLIQFVSNALININILTNFCSTLKSYTRIISNDSDKQYELSLKLIHAWSLENCLASLDDIMIALNSRKDYFLAKLKQFTFNLRYNKNAGIEFEKYFFSDFLDSIKIGILSFEQIFLAGKEQKWALCFDELELVSIEFTSQLINKLRITPSNILFKLSSGPLTEFESSYAQVFHDYEVVKMWPYSHKEEGRYEKFCEEIAAVKLNNYFNKNSINNVSVNFDDFFGELDFKKSISNEFNFRLIEKASDKEPGSFVWNAYKTLASIDESYKLILKSKKIDVNNPIPQADSIYNSFFRKTREIAINRLIFNKYKNGKYVGQRSRKEYLIYYGKDTVFKICEGNPRFIINLVNDLVNEVDNFESFDISPEIQSRIIKSVSSRFNVMLMTYPTSVKVRNNTNINLSWFINKIGNYFEDEINRGPFKIDPANSFRFSTINTHPDILKLIQTGLRLGALVKVDTNSNDLIVTSDTRIRLSYLLHPQYKLPLRLYSSVKLSKIIGNIEINTSVNPTLFDI